MFTLPLDEHCGQRLDHFDAIFFRFQENIPRSTSYLNYIHMGFMILFYVGLNHFLLANIKGFVPLRHNVTSGIPQGIVL